MARAAHIRDPAGLLARIAELEPLCTDLFVRRAVASGDPFRVYRALWWARATFRLRAHRETLRTLLRTRRAFAKPTKDGDLALGTLNGVGNGLVGRAEKEEDGTHIKTRVVELAGFPLFPLGAHLVSVREEFGEIVEATFHARVPLGTGWWLWRTLWTVIAAAVMLASARSAVEVVRRPKVWVVNGHRDVVVVDIGPTRSLLEPGEVKAVRVPAGTHRIRARDEWYSGPVLDEGSLTVKGGGEVLVWNVGGAAPVASREVVYVRGLRAGEGRGPIRCRERLLQLAPADFVFEPPTDAVPATPGEEQIVRRAVWMSPDSCPAP